MAVNLAFEAAATGSQVLLADADTYGGAVAQANIHRPHMLQLARMPPRTKHLLSQYERLDRWDGYAGEGAEIMASLTQAAIENQEPADEVAKAAVKEAASAASTDTEREALALTLYKEATGRFPQDSSDRRAVYTGGYWLVGGVFAAALAAAVFLVIEGKPIPEFVSILATAVTSGVIGGLFGFAKQG